MFASAHGGFAGRSSTIADPLQFRRDVAFLIGQRPGIVIVGYLPKPNLVDIVATQLRDYKGVIVLDPVIGDFQKGLYVSEETAARSASCCYRWRRSSRPTASKPTC